MLTNKGDNMLNHNIKGEDKDKFKQIKKTIGARKYIMLMLKLYNGLCKNCRTKVSRNPKTPVENYCQECQKKIKAKLGKYADD